MTTPEISALVLLGLGLTAAMAFQTLGRLNFPQLTALPKEAAVESIIDVADDVLEEGIGRELVGLCARSGVPLPEGPAPILDVMVNSGHGHDELLWFYQDLLTDGLASYTYFYALDVLELMAEVQEPLAHLFGA